MAEPQNGSSSAVNLKDKKSLLGDMDFGKDFFTSWDSTTGDDAMDFDFGTVAKGKKKAFSFDKLDVDFSFDDDLDKISSFKVDMPDIDISSPLKKSGTRENPKAESGDGSHQRKQDRFSFSFDFNELDSFQFEPSLTKEENKAGKKKDIEEASNKGERQGSRTEQRDIIGASDSLNSNLSASEGMTISKGNPTVGDLGKFDFADHGLSVGTREDVTSNAPPNQNSVEPVEVTLPEMMSDSRPLEIVHDAVCQEERAFPRSCKESTKDSSMKSESGEHTTQVGHSEIQAEVSSVATKDVVRERIGSRDSVASPEHESSLLERREISMTKLCSGDSERKNSVDNDSVSIGNKDGFELAQGVADSSDTSSSNTSRKSLCVIESSREHQSGKSEGGVPSRNSETSKLIERKENEIASVRSKFFKRSDGRESQFRQRLSSQTALAMFPAKLMSSKQQTDRLREVVVPINAQGGNKVVKNLDSVSGEITTSDAEPENARTFKGLKEIGESLDADGLLNGSKSAGLSRLSDKEIRIEEPVRGPEKNTKNLVTLSSALKSPTPIDQISKPTAPSHAISRTVLSTVSIKSSLNSSSKGNKASTPKEIKSLTDLSGLKISRDLGESHCPSNSAVQKKTNSSRNLMQIREVEESAPFNISPSISTAKQSLSPSLKRKTHEASNADTPNIKSLKRISPSLNESRDVRERLQDAKKEVQNYENIAEIHKSGSCQSPTLDVAREMNLTDLKMPLVIESDDNVEKAEAYTKDLEDMCNMLKKKHEEAKELLVRAVVNNNNLLMLNHPIYEEIIRKIEKFAV